MQTFLPYKSFKKSARVLDRQRLGKQRVENLQLLRSHVIPGAGWSNHPASKMWAGHEAWLVSYQIAICDEWHIVRGYKDTCLEKTIDLADEFLNIPKRDGGLIRVGQARPPWLGDKEFHRSHKSNLVRKNADHYRTFFPNVPDDLEYVWPLGVNAS
jgi:hypothetical protein